MKLAKDGRGGGGCGGGGRGVDGEEDEMKIQITLPLGTCGEVGTTRMCFIPFGFLVEALVLPSTLVPCTIQNKLNEYLPIEYCIDFLVCSIHLKVCLLFIWWFLYWYIKFDTLKHRLWYIHL